MPRRCSILPAWLGQRAIAGNFEKIRLAMA